MRLHDIFRKFFCKKPLHQSKRRGKRGFLSRNNLYLSLLQLEDRITPTGNLAITDAFVNDNSQSEIEAGEWVSLKADFSTVSLPSNASYRVGFTVNGLTQDVGSLTWGAGASGLGYWTAESDSFLASPGTNEVTVTVDPDHSVPETTYADNTIGFTFNAATPAVGTVSSTVAQIRNAYGINSIPDFGSAAPDGTGQTIAIVDAFNDPSIITDLDGFDKAMSLTTTSSQNLYQQYGPASSILNVYNQVGTNITANLANSGSNGVPSKDPTGDWEGEETMDVEWAHAIAPGAKIDLIETDGQGSFDDLFVGAGTAGRLPGVTDVSMSWIWSEGNWSNGNAESAYDANTFATQTGHPGVTYLASSGDGGTPGGYPAFSPNVIAVGGTQLTLNNNGYGSETAWSFPTPRTLNNGSSSYSQTGSWTTQSGGFSGSYGTASAGSNSAATWTTTISSSDQGWIGGTEVSATWTPNAGNATNATYQIYNGTAATGTLLGTVKVDQTIAPVGISDGDSEFQELGVYHLSQGDTLTVVLEGASSNGTVVADATGIAESCSTGGGVSRYEAEPSYQLAIQNTGKRTSPDVSFDGSDYSGVTCYQNGSLGYDYYGTSLSSPCWAGLFAIANQGRLAAGGTTFNSPANPQQALQALYSLPKSDFTDIASGYNGYSAGPGYDYLTGLGTPIANELIPDLDTYGLTPTVNELSSAESPLAGGQTITITGSNFLGATAVNFGSMIANNFTIVSSTEITAMIPANVAGTVDVTVATAGGTSPTSFADQFTYTAMPVVTGISPSTGSIDGGTVVTIAGINLGNATEVDFGSTPATIVNYSADQLVVVSPKDNGAGVVDVTVTTPAGTSAASPYDFFDYIDPTTSYVFTFAATVQSDSAITVYLQAGDSSGKILTNNGVDVQFELGGGSGQGTFGTVSYIGDGVYGATFTGTLEGGNTITATVDGTPLTSAPAAITVTPGPVYPAKSLIELPIPTIQLGGVTTVTLQARDAEGNYETTGGLHVVFSLANKTGARGAFSKVIDHHDGTYTTTFTGTFVGDNEITATVDGLPVSAPPDISVNGGAFSTSESTVNAAQSTIGAGSTTVVTLQVKYPTNRDELAGGLSVLFKLGSTTGGQGTFSDLLDLGNGQYSAIFTGTLAGSNTIRAYIDGREVTSTAPAIKVLTGPLSLAKSPVLLSATSMKAGGTITVAFQPEDAGGNKLNLGENQTVVFSLESGQAPFGTVAYNSRTGAYTATFTTTSAGTYFFNATVNGQVVTSKAPALVVTAAAVSLTNSMVNATSGGVQIGSQVFVTVQIEDIYGNPELQKLAIAFALGNGSGKGSFGKVAYLGNGTYQATFTGTKVGSNTIEAFVNGLKVHSAAAITVT